MEVQSRTVNPTLGLHPVCGGSDVDTFGCHRFDPCLLVFNSFLPSLSHKLSLLLLDVMWFYGIKSKMGFCVTSFFFFLSIS